jgi:hypothetical protein
MRKIQSAGGGMMDTPRFDEQVRRSALPAARSWLLHGLTWQQHEPGTAEQLRCGGSGSSSSSSTTTSAAAPATAPASATQVSALTW